MTPIFALLSSIFVLPHLSMRLFTIPRNFIVALSLPVCFAFWNGGLLLDPFMFWSVSALILIWIASTAFARRPEIALPMTYRMVAAVFFGLVAVQGNSFLVFVALVAGGCINTLISIMQGRFKIQIDRTAPTTSGLCGNTNILGAHLLPILFIALHIGDQITYLPATLILIGILESRCRASAGGLVAGLVFVHWSLAIAILVCLFFAHKITLSGLPYRKGIWRHVLRQINWKIALIGAGPDNSKLIFPALRLDIDGVRTKFCKAHNDFLQWVLDSGVFSAIIQLSIMGYSVFSAVSNGQNLLAGAIFALFANGLLFHTQFFSVINVVYWVIVGHVTASTMVVFTVPAGAVGFIAAILAIIFISTWGSIFLSDVVFKCAYRINTKSLRLMTFHARRARWIKAAHKINPVDSFARQETVQLAINQPNKISAFYQSIEAIFENDGEMNYSHQLLFHSIAAINIGSYRLGRVAAVECLKFDPNNKNAKKILEKLKEGRDEKNR